PRPGLGKDAGGTPDHETRHPLPRRGHGGVQPDGRAEQRPVSARLRRRHVQLRHRRSRQGARTGYCTLLGRDPFGDLLLDLWKSEGVATDGVGRHDSAPTGIYFVTHTDKGHAFTYYRKGSAASRMTPADLPVSLLQDTAMLHVSGISLAISPEMRETVMT